MKRTLTITITYTADKEHSVAQLLEALEVCAEVDYHIEPQLLDLTGKTAVRIQTFEMR